jgi:hypothetical protein
MGPISACVSPITRSAPRADRPEKDRLNLSWWKRRPRRKRAVASLGFAMGRVLGRLWCTRFKLDAVIASIATRFRQCGADTFIDRVENLEHDPLA